VGKVMEKTYHNFCIPLMQINSNVYAFVSGILISLSTNIFTTLCFEQFDLASQWHQYISTFFFACSGAICMAISTKVVNFQTYISSKQIVDSNAKREVICDATESKKVSWIFYYFSLLLFFVGGFAMLGLTLFLNG